MRSCFALVKFCKSYKEWIRTSSQPWLETCQIRRVAGHGSKPNLIYFLKIFLLLILVEIWTTSSSCVWDHHVRFGSNAMRGKIVGSSKDGLQDLKT